MRPLRTETTARLPIPPSPFFGRRNEVATVAGLLARDRLVTLTGPGGCGKTRLALEVASHVEARSVFFADVSHVAHGDFVAQTVARAAGLDGPPREMAPRLAAHLAGQDVLLVLDNCEHVLDACAHLAGSILGAAPDATFLCASRERLGAAGEVVYPVRPLELPAPGAPADSLSSVDSVALFLDRARRSRPDFDPASSDLEAIARICRRLDGLPLAIELAAACAAMMPVARIEDGIRERFDLPSRGPRTAARRHRSLRACVDWSNGLLGEPERTVFRRLGAFTASFTAEAAAAVTGEEDVSDALSVLVDKSLVVADPDRDRFVLLRTLRDYAREHLEVSGELPEVLSRHAAAHADLCERAHPCPPSGEAAASAALTPSIEDLLAAFAWCRQAGDADAMCRMAPGLLVTLRGNHRLADAYDLVAPQVGSALERASPSARAAVVTAWASAGPGWYPVVPEPLVMEAVEFARAGGRQRDLALAQVYAARHCVEPSRERRAAWAGEAADIGGASGDEVVVALARSTRSQLDELHDGEAALVAAREAARCAQDEAPGGAARWELITLLGRQGRHSEAVAEAEAVLAGPATGGSARWLAGAHRALSAAHVRGPAGVAAEAAAAADLYFRRTTPTELRPDVLDAMLFCHDAIAAHLRGDLTEAEARYSFALEAVPDGPNAGYARRTIRLWRFWSRLGLADDEGARSDARELAAGGLGSAELDLSPLVTAAAARRAGDPGGAISSAHELLPAAHTARRIEFACTLLEIVAGCGPHPAAEAVRMLAASDSIRRACGCTLRLQPFDLWFEEDVARLRDSLGGGAFRAAWDAAESTSLDEAVALARRGRGRRRRPQTGWESLTPAEREVVDRVAAGLTNQQIAAGLFVSPRTVASHLRRVFDKLGVRSRTQLARIALERAVEK